MEYDMDVLVIGGGGSGLTAGIYLARAGFKTVIVEKNSCGGQIAITDLVENYPGFPDGINGAEISSRMEQQAKRSGAEILFDEIKSISKNGGLFSLRGAMNNYTSKAVVLASGASARKLGLESETKFAGRGVSYCAVCDAPFFRGKEVAVVGGGNAAVQEALYLTKFASIVYVIHRRDKLRAGTDLSKRAFENEKVKFVWNSVVEEILGDNVVTGVRVKNVSDGNTEDIRVNGVFVFIGHEPSSGFVSDFVKCDDKGYVIADDNLETSVNGLFVAGEIRAGAVKQLVASCGEGCKAALAVQHYLENN